ncbi:hypothetical protein Tco_1300460 [Tanacetum coccineum]
MEKDVRNQEEPLRKQFDQETKILVGQGEASITNNTIRLSTVSPSVSVAEQSFDNNDLPTDPLMPDLEDSTDIFRRTQKGDPSFDRSKLDRSNVGKASAICTSKGLDSGPIPLKTAEQKLARKNELKAKSTLLLAIPDEYLLKFHGIKDAKTL